MKTLKIFKLVVIVLVGLTLTSQVNAMDFSNRTMEKKSLLLTIDKPIIEFFANAYGNNLNSSEIIRMQKSLGQIDYISVSFQDKDASDYVLKFKSLDENELETWMFDEGYLKSSEVKGQGTLPILTRKAMVIGDNKIHSNKKSITVNVDQPLIEFVARAYADQINSNDIIRVQKMLSKVDHVTVSFLDEDAVDYELWFKSLDKQGLETWMFNEGFLDSSYTTDSGAEPRTMEMPALQHNQN
jgi:hypothetical protein